MTRVLTKNPTRSSSASSVRPGDRRADRDVGARAQPGQQHRQRGLQHHERRDALGPGQLHQRAGARRAGTRPATGAPRWPATAGRGRSCGSASSSGSAGQGSPPVGDLPRQQAVRVGLVAEQFALPDARSRRTAPAAAASRRRAAHAGPRRPRTGPGPAAPSTSRRWRCGARTQHQHVLVRPAVEQPGPDRHLRRQVEGVPRRLRRPRPAVPPATTGRPRRRQSSSAGSRICWYGSPSTAGNTVRSDSCRPITSRSAASARRRRAAPGEPQRDGHVVGRAGAVQLGEEPQPALGERQRDAFRPVAGAQRGPRAGRPGSASRAARPATVGASNSVRSGSSTPSTRPDPGDQPDREQRVPAEVEEVVVDADRVHAEHLRERRAQQLLRATGAAARPARPA